MIIVRMISPQCLVTAIAIGLNKEKGRHKRVSLEEYKHSLI